MRQNKFDYSDELNYNPESEYKRRLDTQHERNQILAKELREDTAALLDGVRKFYRLSETIQKLTDSLSLMQTCLPLNISAEDTERIRSTFSKIINDALSDFHKEIAANKRTDIVPISRRVFWIMIVVLVWLILFFVVVIYANATSIHNSALWGVIAICTIAGTICIGLVVKFIK